MAPPKKGTKGRDTMPPKEEVERLFDLLTQQMGVKGEKKAQMMMMPLENKWLLIKQSKVTDKKQTNPMDYVTLLKGTVSAKEMEGMSVEMASKPVPWLVEFVNKGGVPPLFQQLTTVLSKPEKVEADVKLLGNFVSCVRGLMNGSEEAIKTVNSSKGATLALIKCLDYIPSKAHRNIWELLTALCYISENSHLQLAEALSKVYKPVDGKKKTSGIKKIKWFLEKGENGSKGIVMSLVNGLVNKCNYLDDRMEMRNNIGVDQELIEKLEKVNHERLTHQLVIFKEELEADMEEMNEVGSGEKECKANMIQLLEAIKVKDSFATFRSMIAHMELIRQDDRVGIDSFHVLDMMVQAAAHAEYQGDVAQFAKEISDSALQELGYVQQKGDLSDLTASLKEKDSKIAKLEEQKSKDAEALQDAKKASRQAKEESTKLRVEANDLRMKLEAGGGAAPAPAPAPAGVDPEKVKALEHTIESLRKDLSASEAKTKDAEASAAASKKDADAAKEAAVAAREAADAATLPPPTDDNKELLELIESLRGKLTKAEGDLKASNDSGEASKKEIEELKAKVTAAEAAAAAAPPAESGGAPPPPPPGPAPGSEGGAPPPPPPPGGAPGAPPPPPPPGGAPGGPPPPPPPPGGGPPPPPGGAPGGPPPPPGAGPPGPPRRPAKKKVAPPVKMKAFNWTKIADTKIDGTIWEEVTDDRIVIDADKLSELFCAARPKPASAEGEKKEDDSGKPKKKVVPTVLDFQRSNNINILVKRFKKTPEQMKKAITTCDPDVMVADNIRALLKVVPTPEELEQINEFPNPEELGGAEQFLMALGSIPRLEARLKALLIKDGFEKRSTVVEEQMNILEKTIEEVRDSKKLTDFLAFVLKIGNFMNGTGARGGAYGFKLQDLVKLGDTKSFDNKTTLLAYMIEYFEKSKPDLVKLGEDFPTIQDGSRESLNEVVKDVNQLDGDRNFAKNQLREGEHDDFAKTISAFLEEADSSLKNLTARKTSIEQKFKNLKKSFGEQPAVDTNDFFANLVKFVALYSQTYETILRKRKSEADKEKRAAKQAVFFFFFFFFFFPFLFVHFFVLKSFIISLFFILTYFSAGNGCQEGCFCWCWRWRFGSCRQGFVAGPGRNTCPEKFVFLFSALPSPTSFPSFSNLLFRATSWSCYAWHGPPWWNGNGWLRPCSSPCQFEENLRKATKDSEQIFCFVVWGGCICGLYFGVNGFC